MSRTVITNVFCIDCLVHRILQFKSTIQQNLTETKLKHSSHITLVNCANVHSSKLCTRVMTLWPKIQIEHVCFKHDQNIPFYQWNCGEVKIFDICFHCYWFL